MATLQSSNEQAKAFKGLHVPGTPLLLANVHDAVSAGIVSSLPGCKALATASYSIALVNGTEDAKLDLETHLGTLRGIAAVAKKSGKPLTVDLQDGYGDRLEEAIKAVIDLGVVGVNLEDCDRDTDAIFDESVAVDRIKRALKVAAEAGLPDFVINARADSYLKGGTLDESIRRGKLYLEAGATAVYILSVAKPLTRDDIQRLSQELDGRVNIALRLPAPGATPAFTTADLASLGISRISIGPQLFMAMSEALKAASQFVFGGGQ
ncbi:Phosphoenolpyruvate/pyruvate domain-containing protein [Thozetella sp. PMI_491]|nr:Phosphoenolpyruvate/pyruvate domain-containing protein [Thozetella sp. PMI_491]